MTRFNLGQDYLNSLGIIDWGYVNSPRPSTYSFFLEWIEQGHHGVLSYLADERKDKRQSLENVFSSFQSALVFAFDYRNTGKVNNSKIASYALGFGGLDYHHVIAQKLNQIVSRLKLQSYKFSIDTMPILERDLAYRAGLGWFGKNSMLIHPKHGSYFMLASILLDHKLELDSSNIIADHCGTCRACIDACPTQAITEKRTLIANKCISTFTIEVFKDGVLNAPDGHNQTEFIFGCDICQSVCPWNERQVRKNIPGVEEYESSNVEKIENFFLKRPIAETINELENMSNRAYIKHFKGTALERTGRQGILKNLKNLLK